jgi:TetR/AcrR family transcriptional regulator, cholesterol catabolism regulator
MKQSDTERIIAYTTPIILSDGFSRLSVDTISSKLGISKKTFYKSFTSKDELIGTVLDYLMREVRNRIEAILSAPEGFLLKLSQVMALLGEISQRLGKPFQQDLERHATDQWKRLQDFRRERIHTHFAALIDQGIAEGYVRKDINRKVFLRAYTAAVDAIVNPHLLANESFSAQEAMESILAIFFHGALTDDASQKLKKLQVFGTDKR